MILFLATLALAAERYPTRPGDTIESIAASHAVSSSELRALNQLDPTAQPQVGQLLTLPDPDGFHADQRAFLLTRRGDVSVQRPGGEPALIDILTPITPGHELCTAPGAYATVRLATQCDTLGAATDDVTLSGDTCVVVESAWSGSKSRSTVIRVLKGSLQVQENATAHGHVTVLTPFGLTVGEKGGYRVSIEENAARTEALYSPVAVQGAGQEVSLAAGQGSRVKEGEAPSEPIDLLAPGQPTLPTPDASLRRPEFTWTPREEAFGYRIEIAATPDFVDMLFVEDTLEPGYSPTTLMLPWPPEGILFWRVSTFDRFGFLGIPSPARPMRLPAAGRG